jgi:DNA-binding transcriptional MerR regulator
MEATNGQERVVNAATSTPTPTLTVAAVARRLGVAPSTLRTWDRRYGLGPSAHTAGAHRRYSPADVARLMVMRRLTLEGVSPADAAKIALATAVPDEPRPMHTPAEGYDLSSVVSEHTAVFDSHASGDDEDFEQAPQPRGEFAQLDWSQVPAEPATAAEFDSDDSDDSDSDSGDPDGDSGDADDVGDSDYPTAAWSGVLRAVPGERSMPGGGRVVAMPDGTPQSRGLARAAMSLDTYETHRIVRDMIRREGTVATWNSTVMPVLRALGERTRVTGDGIDVEHAFSEVILGVLRGVAMSLSDPGSTPIVLLACADSDYHSLPLHALAAALAERGIPTRMLGSGLPPHALSASVRRTGPSVIVLFARMAGADAGDTEALRRQRPAPTLILAGPGWQPETVPSTARTASSLSGAVDEVLRVVHA